MYWRGDHDQSQWESTLAQLEPIAASATSATVSSGRLTTPGEGA
jgi:hypothetical protein